MSMISSYPPSHGSGPRHVRPEDDSPPTFMPPYKSGTAEEEDELDAVRQFEERQKAPNRNTIDQPGFRTMEYRVPPSEHGTSSLDDMLRGKHPSGFSRFPEAKTLPVSKEQMDQFRKEMESAGKYQPTTDGLPPMLAPGHGKQPSLRSPQPWSGDFGFMPPYKEGTPEEEEELDAVRQFEEMPKAPNRRTLDQEGRHTMEYRVPRTEPGASSMPAPGGGGLQDFRSAQLGSGDFKVVQLSQPLKGGAPEQPPASPPEAGPGPQMQEGAAGNGSLPHGTSEPPQVNYTPAKPTPEAASAAPPLAPSGTMQAAGQLPTGGGPASGSSVGAAKSTEAGLSTLQKLVFRELYDKDTPWEEKEKIRKFILSLTPQRGVKDLPQAVKNMQFWFDVDKRAKLPPEQQDLMILPPEFIEKSMAYGMGREKLLNHFRNTAGKKIFPNQTIMEWVQAQANGLTPGGTDPFDIPDTNFDTMTAFPMPFGPDADLYHSMGTFTMQGHGSNLKALQDKDGNIWIDGKIAVNVKDKYDWHTGLNVPITKQTIGQFIPGLYDVKFPPADAFTIEDSFFEEFLDKGLGKDFLMESSGFAPLQLRFSDKTKP